MDLVGNKKNSSYYSNMKTIFKSGGAYSLDEIASELGKSVTNITNILKAEGIDHEGLRGSGRGPDTRIWKGSTLNELLKVGKLRDSLEVGEEIWF